MKKDIVCGLGEIGMPILKLISKSVDAVGYDINPRLSNEKKLADLDLVRTELLHVCIPYSEKFERNVLNLVSKFKPDAIVIHSTIKPNTTEKLQKQLKIPVLYSATRGIHKRMISDLKRYVKFYSVYDWAPKAKWAKKTYENRMKKAGIKTKTMSNPLALELAKIVVDTSYYGWLINYAQLSNMIAIQNKVDYDEMWSFADEIHKYLGNRPKMFPGFIGGHCLDGQEVIYIKTQNGMKPITIQEYVEKDLKNDVLSYDTNEKKPIFDKVTHKWKRRFSGNMVTLTSRTNRSITTTDEHLMLCSDTLSTKFAKDVAINETIPFLSSLPDNNIQYLYKFETKNWRLRYNMPESIQITPDFCRLLGYYVSEGSVSNYGKGYSVRFSFNKKELDYINDVCTILKKLNITYHVYSQNNVTHVGLKSTPLALFISDTLGCGRSSNVKQLPDFIYFAPRNCKEEFLAGYMRGDGSFSPEIGMVQAGTASKMLAAGLDILLLSMGYVMTCGRSIHSPSIINERTIKGGLLYTLVSKGQSQYNDLADMTGFEQFNQRTHSKQLWYMLNETLYMIRTTKTVHEEREQDVYSLDTKNHLFVSTNGRLIHNCVIPNLDLMNNESLDLIREINSDYAKILKKRQSQGKKY
ncbi:MAG TPA: LAGLIDADG family homing endonuclease [Candidatus Nitrosotalea sp.]|nr:LAGLIDADG family homing endonuclease [Candidatus Nitrosotalea sp.]